MVDVASNFNPSNNISIASSAAASSAAPTITTTATNSHSHSNANSNSASSAVNKIDTTIMHPLESEWAFWYDRRAQQTKRARGEKDAYESNLRPLGTFNTVEDFWRYYNHMVKPSKMENNANYHLFKSSVKPMWEDKANARGGKWIITLKGEKEKPMLDQYWENLCLALVGETLDVGEEVTGAVVSRRKAGDRIAIWTRNRDDETSIMAIGHRIRSVVGVVQHVALAYQSHEDSMRSGASYTNPNKYTL